MRPAALFIHHPRPYAPIANILTYALRSYSHAVCKLAKKGLTPSQIGVILRDSHGIAQVKSVTGTKILRVLKRNGKT